MRSGRSSKSGTFDKRKPKSSKNHLSMLDNLIPLKSVSQLMQGVSNSSSALTIHLKSFLEFEISARQFPLRVSSKEMWLKRSQGEMQGLTRPNTVDFKTTGGRFPLAPKIANPTKIYMGALI